MLHPQDIQGSSMVRVKVVQQLPIFVLAFGLCLCVVIMGGPMGNTTCRRRLSCKTKQSSATHVQSSIEAGQTSGTSAVMKQQKQQDMKVALNWYAYWWRKETNFVQQNAARKERLKEKWNLRLMNDSRRFAVLRKFQRSCPDKAHVIESLMSTRSGTTETVHNVVQKPQYREAVLLTWQGGWGNIDRASMCSQTLHKAYDLMPDSERRSEGLMFCKSQAPRSSQNVLSV